MLVQLYTPSRLRTLRACPRLHHYRYDLGIASPESDDMRFGTVGHRALEAYFLAWRDGVALDGRLAVAMAHADAINDPFQRMKLCALLAAYHTRWGAKNWTILAVEVEFRYELGGYVIGGKVDAIIRDDDTGKVFVLEHKTTGQDASAGSAYWERLAIDTQVSIYIDGATMLGYDVAGVIYDVLQRPRHEPRLATPLDKREYTKGRGCGKCGGSAKPGEVARGRGTYLVRFADEDKQIECEGCAGSGWKLDKDGKPDAPRLHANQRDKDETPEEFLGRVVAEIAEAPEAFLIRGDIIRLERDLPDMRVDLIETIAMERALAQAGAAPRNPDNCAKYGSLCSFFAACSGRADIADQRQFPRGRAHPELAATNP